MDHGAIRVSLGWCEYRISGLVAILTMLAMLTVPGPKNVSARENM